MSLSQQMLALFDAQPRHGTRPRREVRLASNQAEVRAAQRLRYRVFVEEMGARLDDEQRGLETDRFDRHCHHLLVTEQVSGEVVGCYRILTDARAAAAGGFYAQTEFDLTRILALPGRLMEVGRACVHPDYRSGATLALLWSGLACFMVLNKFDHLIGSASIPLRSGTKNAVAVYRKLSGEHLAPERHRVTPRVPLPHMHLAGDSTEVRVPALLRAYLRMGAKICGEPAWDPRFNVADLFILLNTKDIHPRYVRHFLDRA